MWRQGAETANGDASEHWDLAAGESSSALPAVQPVSDVRGLSTKVAPCRMHTSLTPQNLQKNNPAQRSRPNLFLGRWRQVPGVCEGIERITSSRVGHNGRRPEAAVRFEFSDKPNSPELEEGRQPSYFLWRDDQVGGLRCPSMLRRLKASAASSACSVTSATLPCLNPVIDPARLVIE